MKLLLISASGSPPFEHCRAELAAFLGASKRVGYVSAANLGDEVGAHRAMAARFAAIQPQLGDLVHVRWDGDGLKALDRVDVVFVGGGNTYVLLQRMSESGLLDALSSRVREGMPYAGSSAGANLAGPNILTTNDWNVVGLTRFEALGLVPFNINPHYVEPSEAPYGETRAQRIYQYHRLRSNPVVGIEEGAVLHVVDGKVSVGGKAKAKVFTRDGEPRWVSPGEVLF